ncbi:MAG: FAD-dependent oxidoreductase [Pseudomonadota bacterium]
MMQKDVDLIVVGGGMGGHCAALAAAELGASVLLLEKMPVYGGSTAMCGGAFAFAGTDMQHAAEVKDTPSMLAEDLLKAGGYHNDPALIEIYAQHQLDAYHWLKAMGIKFESLTLSSGMSVPRTHSTNAVTALHILHQCLLSFHHARYQGNCAVRRLLTEGDDADKAVVGVRIDGLQGEQEIRARGGVVLATGGFSRSQELIGRFAPNLTQASAMGGAGNHGDGLRMAWALGADLLDMGFVKGTFGASIGDQGVDGNPRLMLAIYCGAIAVNNAGRRFVDESLSYKTIGDACLLQPKGTAFQIFDQTVMAHSAPIPTIDDFEGALNAGLVKSAATIRGLAAELQLDADVLETTIQRYNASIDADCADEVGRRSLSTGYGKRIRLDTAPFYGYPCTTGLTSTYCGLRTDVHARVIDVYERVIEGLYATGEVVGGFHGEAYMSGSSLGKACVFGQIAARHAVSRI